MSASEPEGVYSLLARIAKECVCMKKLNTLINIIMGAFIGVFIGHVIYVVWDFKTRPELHALQSAPWYTSILLYGAFTLAVLLVCVMIKVIIKRIPKKTDNKSNTPQ